MMGDTTKTATITFQNANNYGAILQTYALQKTLEKIGCKNEVINYQCEYMGTPYGIAALKRKGFVRYILGNIYALARMPRIRGFTNFRKKILFTSKIYSNDLKDLESNYDYFICGSDQVWNDAISNGDPAYFLDFIQDNGKKKSYAASFGFEKIPNGMEDKYKELLTGFSDFNMREESGASIISLLLEKQSKIVLDPTMLLEIEDWNQIAKEKTVRKKYILIYQVGLSSFLLKKAKEIAKLTGLKILILPFPIGGLLWARIHPSAGPQEWVGLIKNAELVVTDSFHGSAFSIMYNKRFFVSLSEGSTRIRNLLKTFEFEEAILNPGDELFVNYNINWDRVNRTLSSERDRCKGILSEMLRVKQ